MSNINIGMYIMGLISFVLYVVNKYKKRAYLFSLFNIGLYIYTFNIIISPLFFFVDSSWYGLGITSAYIMKIYLNKALLINLVGYIIYIWVLYYREFMGRRTKQIELLARRIGNSIATQQINFIYVFVIIGWYAICMGYCHGLPLFNGQRSFYLNLSISPVYLFFNEIILVCTFFYALQYAFYKKKLIFMMLGIVTIAFQGNRGALIINLILPITLVIIYQHITKKKKNIGQQTYKLSKREKRKAVKKMLLIIPLLVVFGIWLKFVRNGSNSSINNIVFELLYGNTFSDIRDGAFILRGFKENTNDTFLLGKTYLAALISFLPSSISHFRLTWSWGRYTTVGLFGMTNHFGLRGGNVMEAYINFSWLGVCLSAILQGIIGGILEKIFYMVFIKEDLVIYGKEYFIWYLLYLICNTLSSSSSAYNVYTLIVFISVLILATNFVRKTYK